MKLRILPSLTLAAVTGLSVALTGQAATYYTTNVLQDAPLLYWNFDEPDGDVLQIAPVGFKPITDNDLQPAGGAGRVAHADVGGYAKLGRAADLNGNNHYVALALNTGRTDLQPPWAVEFWIQVTGANTDNRADYLINFGNNPGGDNAPAFIYDFEPDTLEVFAGGQGRTSTSPPISDANWHHIVWVYYGEGSTGVGNKLELFVDGVPYGDVRDTYARAIKLNERLLVGAAWPTGENSFEGRLDEIAIYDLAAYGDEAGVSAKVAQLAADHYLEATSQTGNSYSNAVLVDSPLLYWNFDETEGPARQLVVDPTNNDQNTLVSEGAGRIAHLDISSGLDLGNAAEFNGTSYYHAEDLDAGLDVLSPPWAVEFWMQVQGDNSALREDYLINFGTSPGGDNAPAFIYDYNQDQLEVFHGSRTANGPIISDQNWHHILWVYYGDGTNGVTDMMEAYVDGTPLGRNVRASYSRSLKLIDRLLVGAALPDGRGGFEGRLDEVAIYDLRSYTNETTVRAKVSQMAAQHYAAAFGPLSGAVITIAQQPADVTGQRGGTATFSVNATVSGAPSESLTYQWMRDGTVIANATSSSYTTPALGLADVGTHTYSVRIGTIGGVFIISREAVLTVPAPAPVNTFYASEVLNDQPFLYYNFDEPQGPVLQRSPLGTFTVGTANDLFPVNDATRVSHLDAGGLEKLGRAAEFNGNNFFQTDTLTVGRATINPPYAVEFWMQITGDNSGDRQDYLLNFGNPDNSPAFIYDYNPTATDPDALEIYAGAQRTAPSPPVADSDWHHVVWAYYGSGVEIWLDGVKTDNLGRNFARALQVNSRLLVGAALTTGIGGFEGRMDEVAVYDLSSTGDAAAKVAAMVATHRNAATSAGGSAYSEVVLADAPVLYWNFDEDEGNALQRAPINLPQPDNSKNSLVSQLGGTRVDHSEIGSGLMLGYSGEFNGAGYFSTPDLDTSKTVLDAPWAVEYWMQVQGANDNLRADYLANFGTYPGGDNAPAFIYDYNPDQIEVFGGGFGRTTNERAVISDNNWHHILWVFYGSEATGVSDRLDLWIDGANLDNVRNNFSRGIKVSEALHIGASLPGGVDAFEGRIDEFAVYDLSHLTMDVDVAAWAEGLVARHLSAATNAPPRLSFARTGGQMTITWSGQGYVLQENTSATNPTGWTDVAGGGTSPVVVNLPTTGNKFYRLRKP